MQRIRIVEDLIAADFFDRKIFQFLHLCSGQEAAAVGVCAALQDSDVVMGNHRSHGHYLAKGGDMRKMLGEIYGSSEGCCKGFGGSMHMVDRAAGFNGSTPILGSIVSIAAGVALGRRVNGEAGIVAVFIGDGAAEEGSFYETINLAGVMNIPLLIVVEDNRYAVASDEKSRKSPGYDHAKIVTGIGGHYIRVDGQDATAVYEASVSLRETILSSETSGCGVLHADVLRNWAHSGPIKDEKSRIADDEMYREEHDPIKVLSNKMVENGHELADLNELLFKVKQETEEIFSNAIDEFPMRVL